jgi:hypothetical protein
MLAKKSKDEEKKNTSLFKIKDALIPLPTDVRENELSLIDLERQEEAEEELMKKASRKKKKGKK